MLDSVPNSIPNQPKPKGGRRPGAGRKPSTLKGVLRKLPSLSAELILHEINAQQRIIELSRSKDEAIALAAIKFLWEQAYGKAKQALEHSGPNGGPIQYEDFNLHNLSDAELEQLRGLVESAHVK